MWAVFAGIILLLSGIGSMVVGVLRMNDEWRGIEDEYIGSERVRVKARLLLEYSTLLWAGLSYVFAGGYYISAVIEHRNVTKLKKLVAMAAFCIITTVGALMTLKEGCDFFIDFARFGREICSLGSSKLSELDFSEPDLSVIAAFCKQYHLTIAATTFGSVAFFLGFAGSIFACNETCSSYKVSERNQGMPLEDQRSPPPYQSNP